jgi:hypothetical protein
VGILTRGTAAGLNAAVAARHIISRLDDAAQHVLGGDLAASRCAESSYLNCARIHDGVGAVAGFAARISDAYRREAARYGEIACPNTG